MLRRVQTSRSRIFDKRKRERRLIWEITWVIGIESILLQPRSDDGVLKLAWYISTLDGTVKDVIKVDMQIRDWKRIMWRMLVRCRSDEVFHFLFRRTFKFLEPLTGWSVKMRRSSASLVGSNFFRLRSKELGEDRQRTVLMARHILFGLLTLFPSDIYIIGCISLVLKFELCPFYRSRSMLWTFRLRIYVNRCQTGLTLQLLTNRKSHMALSIRIFRFDHAHSKVQVFSCTFRLQARWRWWKMERT